jgi:CIC family chloride channel protein
MIREGEPRLLLESALLGVLGALAAQLFTLVLHLCNRFFLYGLAGYMSPGLENGHTLHQTIGPDGLWMIPVVTTLGGLLSGILVYYFAPEAEGHGTDAVVTAFHRKEGLIRPRVAPIKLVSSAITIGSGGSAGREGPIALVAAGLGSAYARLAHRSEQERRLLLLAGMAAGLSAIFRSPIGSAVFAVEILYGNMDFEVGTLLYTVVSSAVAYAVNGVFAGSAPLFRVPHISVPMFSDDAAYVALGVAAGLMAAILPQIFYRMRDLFRAVPAPIWTKPAIGGLAVGLLALRLPQVLGGGYGWIQLAINGQLTLFILLVLMLAKTIAFSFTVSSGGSGGVFAPTLFVGAMLGGSFAVMLHQVPQVFVVVGMAAVFGAAARVPIATTLMVTEMTGGYRLLIPAGLAVLTSYVLQVWLSSHFKYRSLYEGQVPTREDSPSHYLEHIQLALNLLGKRGIPRMDKIGHLDLLRLLRSRIQFDLPGRRQLTMSVVRQNNSFVGNTIHSLYQHFREYDFELVAIMRREHVLLPHPDTLLEADDRVILITSPEASEALKKHLGPISQIERSGVQIPTPRIAA